MIKIYTTLIFYILVSTNVWADPAPFGLEIGKATISDVESKYKTKYTDENRYSGGDMYELETSQLGIEGLESATAIFDKEKRLVAILTTFHKQKFDYLFSTMKKKYKLASKSIPFVGNKSAKFKNGESTIFLEAPHLSFQMSMNYVSNNFWKKYQSIQRKEAQQKKKAEESKL